MPDIGEVPVLWGNLVQQGNEMECSHRIWSEVAEIITSSDPDSAGIIRGERADDAHRCEDLPPGDAVVFNDGPAAQTEVDEAAAILRDGPYLLITVVFLVSMGLQDRCADFLTLRRRRVRRRTVSNGEGQQKSQAKAEERCRRILSSYEACGQRSSRMPEALESQGTGGKSSFGITVV